MTGGTEKKTYSFKYYFDTIMPDINSKQQDLYGYWNNNTTNNPAKALVKFEKKLNKEIKKTSDKELDEFIQQFSDAGLNGEEKVHNQADSEVKELLKDVSETELKEFLEETSETETKADEPSLMN